MARIALAAFGLFASVIVLLVASISMLFPATMFGTFLRNGGHVALMGQCVLIALTVTSAFDAILGLIAPRLRWMSVRGHTGLWCIISFALASQAAVSVRAEQPWPMSVAFVWLSLGALSIGAMYLAERSQLWNREAQRWQGL